MEATTISRAPIDHVTHLEPRRRGCARVVAYEPNADKAALLRLAAAGNVEVVCRALSDRTGRGTLAVPIIEGRPAHGLGRVTGDDDEACARHFEIGLVRLADEPLENVVS